MRNYLKLGDWNAVCKVCAFKFKASQLMLRWDGVRVCKDCYEERHPSDLYRYTGHESAPPWTSPEPTDVFTDVSGVITTELDTEIISEIGLYLFTET